MTSTYGSGPAPGDTCCERERLGRHHHHACNWINDNELVMLWAAGCVCLVLLEWEFQYMLREFQSYHGRLSLRCCCKRWELRICRNNCQQFVTNIANVREI